MPYSPDVIGIYRISNVITGQCYVGQSQAVRKRISEHFRLLRKGEHYNPKLQYSFNKYGIEAFTWELEIECEDVNDLDTLENAFLQREAEFDLPSFFNIATEANVVMRGRKHTAETKLKISNSKKGVTKHVTDSYRETLRVTQRKRLLSIPEHKANIKFVIENNHMSYAERGRIIGRDTSSVRTLYLRNKYLLGKI